MSDEIWKAVEGFNSVYFVSNQGSVKSFAQVKTGKLLIPQKVNGYLQVQLTLNGKRITKLIHVLVAQAFVPNPENLPQVNHKDEVKENNFDFNLEWCTSAYNINYGSGINKRAKTRSQKVLQLNCKTGEVIKEWESTAELGRSGYIQAAISYCCTGKRMTHRGYKWKYKDEEDT